MSDGRKYFCFCEANCKFETMTKEQILAAIAQAAETGLVFDADAAFITKVKESNAGSNLTFWLGTQAQYNAIVTQGKKDPQCFYIITDCDTPAELTQKVKVLQERLSTLTAADVGARPNTWLPTIAEIGAAPAGYGLGEELPTFHINDLNSATKTGTYRYVPGSANAPTISGEWVRCESYSATFKHQTAFVSYTGGNIAERWMMNGVWGEFEWRNPPMTLGVEYRTTERWNGNPVYTALISYGKGPSSGACNIQIGSVTGTNVVFVEANCKGVNGNGWGKFYNQYLSFGENGTDSAVFSLSNAGDLSDQTIYLTVKYYKV